MEDDSSQSCVTPPEQTRSYKRKKFDEPARQIQEKKPSLNGDDAQPSQPVVARQQFNQKITREMASLLATREKLCCKFFSQETDFPELCLALDDIGKSFEKLCVVCAYIEPRKFNLKLVQIEKSAKGRFS